VVLVPEWCEEVRVLRGSVFVAPSPNYEVGRDRLEHITRDVGGPENRCQEDSHVQSYQENDFKGSFEDFIFEVKVLVQPIQ
jgi:hypothetical protein